MATPVQAAASRLSTTASSMAMPATAVAPPRAKRPREDVDFGFPFTPYALQTSFMNSLYGCLDEGGVGIFESPTGTGKSLSLVCGTLRWLIDQQSKAEEQVELETPAENAGKNPSWVLEQARDAKLQKARSASNALADARKRRAERLAKHEARLARAALAERSALHGRPAAAGGKAAAAGKAAAGKAGAAEEDFSLAEWEETGKAAAAEEAVPAPVSDLEDGSDAEEAAEEAEEKPWQILYCSRTHSQLAQVVGEVRKTGYGEQVSVVTLGSRKSLCTNEAVRSLSSAERINEACLELKSKTSKAKAAEAEAEEAQRRAAGGSAAHASWFMADGKTHGGEVKGSKAGGCPYLRAGSAEGKAARQALEDTLLQSPLDVEELGALGRKDGCCAYYASRDALPHAQLVLLPYNSLLHAGTREALGVSLSRSVVVIDEAHNLIDTVNQMHSVTLTARHLSDVSAQLAAYSERYQARLKPANRICVQQLLHVVRALRTALQPGSAAAKAAAAPAGGSGGNVAPPATAAGTGGAAAGSGAASGAASEIILNSNAFLCSLNIDNINLYRLQDFCAGSEIAKKLRGFSDAQSRACVTSHSSTSRPDGADGSVGTLHGVIRVLDALTNLDADCRVLLHIEPAATASSKASSSSSAASAAPAESSLKVLHLNPAVYFSRVLSEAHAIILAGGTMQPFADLEQQVFRELPPGRLRTYSFGHIVPPANLLPIVLPQGPSGTPMTFTFGSRATPALMDELGRVLLLLARTVPDGLVVFLPSFSYEEALVTHWQASGLYAQLSNLKRVFREPREASELDAVLSTYAATMQGNYEGGASRSAPAGGGVGGGGQRGAVLLSVVGGKMSEGINFADGLGRCVLMVGLPFANPSELTLQERMAHLDATQGKGAGREYYTNLCMKAVNQSIGRAIRHIGDYATIVLADGRYAKPTVKQRLPKWIASRLVAPATCEQAIGAVGSFFASRRTEQAAIEEKRRAAAQEAAAGAGEEE